MSVMDRMVSVMWRVSGVMVAPVVDFAVTAVMLAMPAMTTVMARAVMAAAMTAAVTPVVPVVSLTGPGPGRGDRRDTQCRGHDPFVV